MSAYPQLAVPGADPAAAARLVEMIYAAPNMRWQMRAHNGAQHLAANVAGRITDDIGPLGVSRRRSVRSTQAVEDLERRGRLE